MDTFGPITEDFDENSFWIGLSDEAEEGVWQWSSGEPVTYTNWAIGEPSGSPYSHEDYGYIGRYSDATWNDVWSTGEGPYSSRGVAEIVPEPATLSLMVLGGLTALIRRRKR